MPSRDPTTSYTGSGRKPWNRRLRRGRIGLWRKWVGILMAAARITWQSVTRRLQTAFSRLWIPGLRPDLRARFFRSGMGSAAKSKALLTLPRPAKALQGLVSVLAAALAGGLLTGCSPLYTLRAAYEEGKILWRREPIVDLLRDPATVPDTREKLRLVLSVRDYARDRVGLNVGGSYSTYSYVDRPDLTYIVIAAPKTELKPYTWWFLIVGSVPYKGFFDKEDALAEIERLKAQGYDTYLRTAAAFSTLGWFDDPLLSHLLRFDRVVLSSIVFHELFHNTLYVNGAAAFNESSANFIGHRAAIDFFRERSGKGSADYLRALQLWDDEKQFGAFIAEVAGTLDGLYSRDIPRGDKLRLREEVFARSKAEWARRIADRPEHPFRAFAEQPLNNAVLMHYIVYLKDLDLFEALYQANGKNLRRTVASLKAAAATCSEPFTAVRALLNKNGAAVLAAGG